MRDPGIPPRARCANAGPGLLTALLFLLLLAVHTTRLASVLGAPPPR